MRLSRIRAYVLLAALAVIFCLSLSLDLFFYARRSAGTSDRQTVFSIPPGQGLKAITRRLDQRGLVQHPFKFKLLARVLQYDKQIKAGEYLLSPALTPLTILEHLVAGKVKHYRVTIPEGFTMLQIAEVLAARDLVSQAAFMAACRSEKLLSARGIAAHSFEGYLFPDTYYFSKPLDAGKVISRMFDRFQQMFSPKMAERAEALNMTRHEVVTLASIIEKETGVPDERPIISSVFHNRLAKKMRLASDPTVIYGIEDFDGNLTRAHLKAKTPYNTYRINGLPPGPIANPGLQSLLAALYPADTEYLYFVAKKDRRHHFSTSLKAHNRAVKKYQLRR